jgi:alpha-beta hydrolase superfamily lysophospholipase
MSRTPRTPSTPRTPRLHTGEDDTADRKVWPWVFLVAFGLGGAVAILYWVVRANG